MTQAATMTLADFLLARIADDEAAYRSTLDKHWVEVGEYLIVDHDEYAAPVIVSKERMLAECEAKRRMIELHAAGWARIPVGGGMVDVFECVADRSEYWPCPTLRLLALPYADHRDYRQEWRP